jgi:hypothetical protein
MQSVQAKAAKFDGEQMDALLKRFERPLLQYATRILGDSDRARERGPSKTKSPRQR